ncbi:MAG TPA: FecR domain-containing protein, partial [Candidatus Gracilibacteria bacterium]|nr:FecR domain-containing protein [Candidatus Gracilibacteria bacterium]
MGKLIKKIVIILLAFGVFASTIFVESRIPVEAMSVTEKRVVVVPGDKEIQPGAEITTGSTESITVRYDDNGVVRLAPSSSVTFVKEGEDGYVFRLNSGRAWVNNVFTSSYLNVQSGGSLLLPRKAAFDIEAKNGSSVVRVFSSQVIVGLIPSDFAADKILRFQDSTLINSFLLAQGSQATISNDKVAQNEDVLRKLLYSKLIKEFQSSLMDKAAVAEDSWIADNLKADQELVRNVSQLKVDAINGRNLKFSSLESFAYQMDQTFSRMSDTLTFSEEKKTKRLIEGIFDHIYDTEYLLVFGRSTEAKERMNLFKKLIAEQFAGADEKMKSLLLGKLRKLYADLNFVLPDNALYEVKVAVSDLLASQLGHDAADITEKLGLIRDYINYAYALADTNLVQARLSLQQYYDRFTALMEAERSRLESVRFLVSEENQILDNLLRQYP